MMEHMLYGISDPIAWIFSGIADMGIDRYTLFTLCIFTLLLWIYDYVSLSKNVLQMLSDVPIVLRWMAYLGFLLLICVFSQKGVAAEFVYFQF